MNFSHISLPEKITLINQFLGQCFRKSKTPIYDSKITTLWLIDTRLDYEYYRWKNGGQSPLDGWRNKNDTRKYKFHYQYNKRRKR